MVAADAAVPGVWHKTAVMDPPYTPVVYIAVIMTRAAVGLMENEIGSSRAIPTDGPNPGIIPMIIPPTTPTSSPRKTSMERNELNASDKYSAIL